MKNKFAISITTLLIAGSMMAAPVVANAVESSEPSVAASRSFTAVADRTNDLLTESSSVSVSGDTTWENTESLKVEQVKSPAEIKAEEEAKKAEEEAKAAAEKAAAEAAAQQQAQQQAASRNQTRTSQNTSSSSSTSSSTSSSNTSSQNTSSQNTSSSQSSASTSTAQTAATSSVASSAKGSTIVNAALSHMGQAMWCTDLVTAAIAAVGVNFGGWPAQYANIPGGVRVASISQAQPGDVLVYGNSHVAIYMGNNKAVHGGWGGYPNVGTGPALGTSAGTPTAIVRIP